MSKKEDHKRDLSKLLAVFLENGDDEKIERYLAANSNLPGQRANLELAEAFAEAAEDYSKEDPEKIWNLCSRLTEIASDEAPANSPREFLPFCGAYSVGAIGSVHPRFFKKSLSRLRKIADDPRWRMREAVAKGVQKLLGRENEKTLKELEAWIEDNEWLAMRAVAAGVAEPVLLKSNRTAKKALTLHKEIFEKILATKERKSLEFKTLKKGLGYTLSVVVHAIPREGFRYMRQLADSRDNDILTITRENLRKNRLVKNFPEEVVWIQKLLHAKTMGKEEKS